MPIEPKDLFSAEFKEVGDAIRHFSTTRSALTTFLLTVGLGAFAAYFHRQQTSPFFVAAGFTFLTASLVVCFRFSYLTERYRLYQRQLWVDAKSTTLPQDFPAGARDFHPPSRHVLAKMQRDSMNWLLSSVVAVLVIGFAITALFRDPSAGIPIVVCTLLITLLGATVALVGYTIPARY